MTIGIYYYSGAGNTEFIAKALRKRMQEQGVDVRFMRITDRAAADFDSEVDTYLIGFPVYALQAPPSVRSLIEHLPRSDKPIAFFCTKAMASADAVLELSRVAEEKGLTTVAVQEFYMPGTDMLGVAAQKGSWLEKVLLFFHSRHIGRKLDRFLIRIQRHKKVKLRHKWYVHLAPFIPQRWKDAFYDQYTRYVPDFYSEPDTCIECMKCVNDCPRENIRFDGQILFGLDCDMCLRCLHHCPTEAIQIGEMTRGTVRYKKVKIRL